MTQILTFLSHKFVIQVSDRRLSYLKGNNIVKVEDGQNKAIFLRKGIVFSYTGLGSFRSSAGSMQMMDDWLAETLSYSDAPTFVECCASLAMKATEVFGSLALDPAQKRHAFVAACWVKVCPRASEQPLHQPAMFTISNALDDRGNWQEQSMPTFVVHSRVLERRARFCLEVTGQPLDKETRFEVESVIRSALRNNKGPRPIAMALANAVRMTSVNKRNPAVGPGVMILAIPKSILSPARSFIARSIVACSLPSRGAPTFFCVPRPGEEHIQHSPILVESGGIRGTLTSIVGDQIPDDLAELHKNAKPWVPDAIVLTPWIGAGSFRDERRPAIADTFQLQGYSQMCETPTWPIDEPSPYYGCLVAIQALDAVVEAIKSDPSSVVLAHKETLTSIPSADLPDRLHSWFAIAGMREQELAQFTQTIRGQTLEQIISHLCEILFRPK